SSAERVEEAVATGARTIATGCTFCQTMLGDGLAAARSAGQAPADAEVADVSVLLLAAQPGSGKGGERPGVERPGPGGARGDRPGGETAGGEGPGTAPRRPAQASGPAWGPGRRASVQDPGANSTRTAGCFRPSGTPGLCDGPVCPTALSVRPPPDPGGHRARSVCDGRSAGAPAAPP